MIVRNLRVIVLQIALSGLLAAMTGFAGYNIFVRSLEQSQAELVQSYISVRAQREQALFQQAQNLTEAARRVFRLRLANLDGVDVEAEFDRLFPLFGDGTRRSAPELFEGITGSDGDHVYGVGAFLGDGASMSMTEKQRYLAAFHAVRSVGDANLGEFTSLYYFTHDRRVLMFAPNRPDRLEFYRIAAPADFDLRGDEDDDLINLELNPHSEMQCTRLSRFVYEEGGERAASACRLPMRIENEFVGAFGTSIEMDDYLSAALDLPPAHGVNMLFDRDGNLISRGERSLGEHTSGRDSFTINSAGLISYIDDSPDAYGVFRDPGSSNLIAFIKVERTGWYFVSIIQDRSMVERARSWSLSLMWAIFALSLIIAGLRSLVMQLGLVQRPLRDQADSRPQR